MNTMRNKAAAVVLLGVLGMMPMSGSAESTTCVWPIFSFFGALEQCGNIFVRNNTCEAITSVAVRFKDHHTEQWRTECCWDLDPGEAFYLSDSDENYYGTGRTIYVWAEMESGRTFSGRHSADGYDFMRINDGGRDYDIVLGTEYLEGDCPQAGSQRIRQRKEESRARDRCYAQCRVQQAECRGRIGINCGDQYQACRNVCRN